MLRLAVSEYSSRQCRLLRAEALLQCTWDLRPLGHVRLQDGAGRYGLRAVIAGRLARFSFLAALEVVDEVQKTSRLIPLSVFALKLVPHIVVEGQDIVTENVPRHLVIAHVRVDAGPKCIEEVPQRVIVGTGGWNIQKLPNAGYRPSPPVMANAPFLVSNPVRVKRRVAFDEAAILSRKIKHALA